MAEFSQIEGVLRDLFTSVPGVHGIVLADEDGSTLYRLFRPDRSPSADADGVAALAAAVHAASGSQGAGLGLGKLRVVFCEFEAGNVVSASRGRAIVCVVTDAGVALARIGTIMELLVDVVAQGLAAEAAPARGWAGERVDEGFAQVLRELEGL